MLGLIQKACVFKFIPLIPPFIDFHNLFYMYVYLFQRNQSNAILFLLSIGLLDLEISRGRISPPPLTIIGVSKSPRDNRVKAIMCMLWLKLGKTSSTNMNFSVFRLNVADMQKFGQLELVFYGFKKCLKIL